MGSVSTPRLYRKPSGTYFLRILLEPSPSSGATPRRKRSEVRWSLRTKDTELARLRASRAGWQDVPAVRDGELHEIKSPLILQPGPAALTDGLDALHRIVTGWAERQDAATKKHACSRP